MDGRADGGTDDVGDLTSDQLAERARLRDLGRARRAEMPAPARAAAARDVVARLAAHPRVRDADGVVLTNAIGAELDLAGLWPLLWERGTVLALPRVATPGLLAVAVDRQSTYESGWHGVQEPVGPALDLGRGRWTVLVPGLAFDPAGNRLGYGGGHFDHFLADNPDAVPVGVCFHCQLVPAIPFASHDVPMVEVVTERGGADPAMRDGTLGTPR